jgi:hypothetical protein
LKIVNIVASELVLGVLGDAGGNADRESQRVLIEGYDGTIERDDNIT